MHCIEREGTQVYYLQLLCDECYFYEFLDRLSITLHENLAEPIMIDGILEYDLMYDEVAIVLQYDPSLGITMYLNSMELATAAELAVLQDFATLIEPII